MADERMKDALRRLFRVLARLSKDEGFDIDVRDKPQFKALCDDPLLASMTDEEMRARLRPLVKTATDFLC
jgi:hypothetical protein